MKHHHIDTNGVTIHAVETGSGPAVLFCHGFPDTWRGWRSQMEAVASAGYRAVSLDMRGYGESSAPADVELYTPFHTVGDLIGVMEALEIGTATLVGHDLGAIVTWNAALMRPDRFTAVFNISVAFIARGGKSLLQAIRDTGREDLFYMFRQISPDADAAWADAATTVPGMLYWTSASPPAADRWHPYDPARGLLRPAPDELPEWVDREDLRATVGEFERTGFHGALNHYRAIQPFFELSGAYAGATVRQPAHFLIGEADGVSLIRPVSEAELRKSVPGLRAYEVLEGVGHWAQLEAPGRVNAALLGFLTEVAATS